MSVRGRGERAAGPILATTGGKLRQAVDLRGAFGNKVNHAVAGFCLCVQIIVSLGLGQGAGGRLLARGRPDAARGTGMARQVCCCARVVRSEEKRGGGKAVGRSDEARLHTQTMKLGRGLETGLSRTELSWAGSDWTGADFGLAGPP